MKRIKGLVLLLLVVFSTGCAKRSALSADDFYEKTNKDYKVTDVKREHYDFSDGAYAISGKNNLKVIFVDTTEQMAKSIYVDETKNFYSYASTDLKEQNKDDKDYELKESDIKKVIATGDNFSIVEISTSKKYYRISWIKDTVMIGQVDVSDKTTLFDLMKKLGY